MYRISVTTIEKFRRYMVGASPYDTEESVLESIKGLFFGNDKTKTGSCYHKVIEQEAKIVAGGLVAEADGVSIFFTDEQAGPAVRFKAAHKHMIHEVPVNKIYNTANFGLVQVSGRVDGLDGQHIRDTKTKYKPIDKLTEYSDSYQWRFYMDMLGADLFYYDIFEVRGFEALKGAQPYRLEGVEFCEPVNLECARHGFLADDCRLMLQEFLEYIELRQLWGYLKQAPEPTPASL